MKLCFNMALLIVATAVALDATASSGQGQLAGLGICQTPDKALHVTYSDAVTNDEGNLLPDSQYCYPLARASETNLKKLAYDHIAELISLNRFSGDVFSRLGNLRLAAHWLGLRARKSLEFHAADGLPIVSVRHSGLAILPAPFRTLTKVLNAELKLIAAEEFTRSDTSESEELSYPLMNLLVAVQELANVYGADINVDGQVAGDGSSEVRMVYAPDSLPSALVLASMVARFPVVKNVALKEAKPNAAVATN